MTAPAKNKISKLPEQRTVLDVAGTDAVNDRNCHWNIKTSIKI